MKILNSALPAASVPYFSESRRFPDGSSETMAFSAASATVMYFISGLLTKFHDFETKYKSGILEAVS